MLFWLPVIFAEAYLEHLTDAFAVYAHVKKPMTVLSEPLAEE